MKTVLLLLAAYGFIGKSMAEFHTDPTMNHNVKSALKYLGKSSNVQLDEIEKLTTESGAEKPIRILDAAVRRQGAALPLKYPRPPFRDPNDLIKLYETNPNADLFTLFKTEWLSSVLGTELKKEVTPVELSKILSKIPNSALTLEQWSQLTDQVSAYMIRCYNTLIVKAGHCHGPTRPLPESH